MFETVNASVRYAKSPTAIGVVTHGDKALLVDSGLDENLARKVVNALANEGVSVAAVINTHGHADHIGGNAFLVKRTGAQIVAPHFEHFFVERPDLEPYTLFGALAPRALQGKFLQAQPSRVDHAVREEGLLDIAGFGVRFHALPGHSVRQMGVEIDGVLFVGDAVLPEAIRAKYGLVFAVDPPAARESARRLLERAPAAVVAYHGGYLSDVGAAVRDNVAAMDAVEARLLALLARAPATEDEMLVDLLDAYPPSHATIELHALNRATLRGYLAGMERARRVECYLDRAHVKWRLIP